MSLPVFPLFPQLPTELRLRIWTLSFPQQRTIYISTSIKNGRLLFIEYQHGQKPSPLLRTSWEARSCYLKTHHRLFLHSNSSSYCNPRLDVLHFDKKSFAYLLWVVSVLGESELARKEILKVIRKIETDVDGIEEIMREQRLKDVIGPLLREFCGLKELCWVLQKRGSFYRRFRDEEGPRFYVRHEDNVWADAGRAAMAQLESAFGEYGKRNPDVKIPALRVNVNLPGFLL